MIKTNFNNYIEFSFGKKNKYKQIFKYKVYYYIIIKIFKK